MDTAEAYPVSPLDGDAKAPLDRSECPDQGPEKEPLSKPVQAERVEHSHNDQAAGPGDARYLVNRRPYVSVLQRTHYEGNVEGQVSKRNRFELAYRRVYLSDFTCSCCAVIYHH